MTEHRLVTANDVRDWVIDARSRTLELVADLDDTQIMGPQLDIINPLLWEIGHVAWFQEKWVLRESLGTSPIRADADALWDSIAIAHDTRWDLPLPTREGTLQYIVDVRDSVIEALQGDPSDKLLYYAKYCVFHEDMHTEAFTYTRQTMAYTPPNLSVDRQTSTSSGGPLTGDVEISVSSFQLGAEREASFAFDNEKWAFKVPLADFTIARAAVTQTEFAAFVDDDGYTRQQLWADDGWMWREVNEAKHPVYWRRDGDGWERRHFNEWVSLEPHRPVIHVNWHEANAYCRWAGRRLPTEAEWEAAATVSKDGRALRSTKPTFPWGNDDVTANRANMNWASMACVDVGAYTFGDSDSGCRQMLGNVWEWTSSPFIPYPDFDRDFYAEYSEPWFGTPKVLRGGAWTTRSRMLRNTWRNFYEPHRRDVLAGCRTCALM